MEALGRPAEHAGWPHARGHRRLPGLRLRIPGQSATAGAAVSGVLGDGAEAAAQTLGTRLVVLVVAYACDDEVI